MVSGNSRSQKLSDVKQKLALHRLDRIAQRSSRDCDWSEATENISFHRSLCKDPDDRDEIDIENILHGLKLCKALQVCFASTYITDLGASTSPLEESLILA
jgi:hypothetical protein